MCYDGHGHDIRRPASAPFKRAIEGIHEGNLILPNAPIAQLLKCGCTQRKLNRQESRECVGARAPTWRKDGGCTCNKSIIFHSRLQPPEDISLSAVLCVLMSIIGNVYVSVYVCVGVGVCVRVCVGVCNTVQRRNGGVKLTRPSRDMIIGAFIDFESFSISSASIIRESLVRSFIHFAFDYLRITAAMDSCKSDIYLYTHVHIYIYNIIYYTYYICRMFQVSRISSLLRISFDKIFGAFLCQSFNERIYLHFDYLFFELIAMK